MLEIIPIPAFKDNYLWLLHQDSHAVVVDPGDAEPVIQMLQDKSLTLDTILITHHHSDHIGGVNQLLKLYQVPVYAPQKENYDFKHVPVEEGSTVYLPYLDLTLVVLEMPGHTLGHVVYYGANKLFCGDTLFGGGCGRLFEGTPQQMFRSLQRLATLPYETEVYCTHEYTEYNLRFASQVDPDNAALQTRIKQAAATRGQGLPTLPSTIQLELETNPFLRCHTAAMQAAAGVLTDDPLAVFTAIREMRNHF